MSLCESGGRMLDASASLGSRRVPADVRGDFNVARGGFRVGGTDDVLGVDVEVGVQVGIAVIRHLTARHVEGAGDREQLEVVGPADRVEDAVEAVEVPRSSGP